MIKQIIIKYIKVEQTKNKEESNNKKVPLDPKKLQNRTSTPGTSKALKQQQP